MGEVKRPARERIAFVTGKLAAPALRQSVEKLAATIPFDFEVVVLNIAVAALMTAEWVARRLRLEAACDRVVLPGYCRGELDVISKAVETPVELGPKDLRDLPRFFGQGGARPEEYGDHDIEIVAEINHVPQLTLAETLAVARRYRDDGADVIDLGCDPGAAFAGIATIVEALRDEGLRVSIDSLDPAEIVPAVAAGAELVLSVNSTNIDIVPDLAPCEVVVIPDRPATLDGLDAAVEKLCRWDRPFRLDPILDPIGFGFAPALARYAEVRRRYPDVEMLMGIGNLTELTGVDTAAINVVLLGFCEELAIRSILTTQVAHWARSCVRELDLARRLVHYSIHHKSLPQHLEPDLHLLRDEVVEPHGETALDELAAQIKDRNIRIFAEAGEIHAVSASLHVRGTDPYEVFQQLGIDDASHAFYIGYELSKAATALTLGKNYVQDEALRWGFLTIEEKRHYDGPRE